MSAELAPLVSFVTAVQNTATREDSVGRCQHSMDSILSIAEIIELPVEYILVEWNPPLDMPNFHESLRFQNYESPARCFMVPKEYHDRIPNPHGQRFFEWRAKNVGVRRARGKFVVALNADNVVSLDLMIALRNLREDSFYRVNRHDIMEMGGQPFRIKRANGDFAPDEPYIGVSKTGVPYSENMLFFNSSGDFMCMSRDAWFRMRGYPEGDHDGCVDGECVLLAHQMGLKQVILEEPLFHLEHSRGDRNPFMPQWEDAAPYANQNQTDDWGLPELDEKPSGAKLPIEKTLHVGTGVEDLQLE
jgi:hypothetical protein